MPLNYLTDDKIDNELELLDEASVMLTPVKKFEGDVYDHMEAPSDHGDKMSWGKTQNDIRLRPAELSIWTGISGHGKTGFLNQIIGSLLQNRVVVIASLEMRPRETIFNMIRQSAGCYPSRQYVKAWIDTHQSNLWIYDQTNQVAPERILAMANYASRVLKADHIVIDSLMKCGLKEDDYNAQKVIVDRLSWIAKTHGAHIHLVAHSRKIENEYKMPAKFDIAGSSSITNLADNVFVVFRNKRREEEIAKKAIGQKFKEAEIHHHSTRLKVCKNRHGGVEPMYGFYFHEESRQFTAIEGKPVHVSLSDS